MTTKNIQPIPFHNPPCSIAEGTIQSTLKLLEGKWVAGKAILDDHYRITFYLENDSTRNITFDFPYLRLNESAGYIFSSRRKSWTVKGPNSVTIDGRMKIGNIYGPVEIGTDYLSDTLSVWNTDTTFNVKACDIDFLYYYKSMPFNSRMSFNLSWKK